MEVANAEDLLEMWNATVKAAGAKDLMEASHIVEEWEKRPRQIIELRKLSPLRRGNLQSQFDAVHDRRKAAVALAARMFRLKNDREPSDIHELVPEFLAEAPLDPMKGHGQTMDLR